MKKKLLFFVAVFMLVFQFSASASSPYNSYTYDANGMNYSAPDAFNYERSIRLSDIKDNTGKPLTELNKASDMLVSNDGLIYITDTGNCRIVVLNSDFSFNKIIDSFELQITDESGNKVSFVDKFKSPTCTFINESNGDIYICDQHGADTFNTDAAVAENIVEGTSGRVVILDKNGKFKHQIAGIKPSIVPDDFVFQPTSIVVDITGRIFVLSYSFNMGIMEFSSQFDFVQCMGAPSVSYNVFELIARNFSTEEQRDRMQDFVPTEYSGIDIDEDGFIYVTNSAFSKKDAGSTTMLSKLNAKGGDVLRKLGGNPYGDDINDWKGNYQGPSKLEDVVTLDYGMYAVLDALRGKVFVYNTDGINLFEFGTVPDNEDSSHKSYINGTLSHPVALEWLDNCALVLDADLMNINVYRLTEYGQMIVDATELHNEDKYDDEVVLWEKVLKYNNNNTVAKQSIGRVYYNNGEWQKAMKSFKEIRDSDNFSKSYKYQRQEYIEAYFGYAVLVLVLLLILIAVIKRLWKKFIPPVKDDSYFGKLKFAKVVLFRPLHGYWYIVRENRASVASATTILLGASIMSLLQARFTGFIFDVNAEYTNMFMEIAKIIVPVMLFVVCNWCVTSLLNGEGNFKTIYIATSYALTPIIILYPIAILLSNVMVLEEGNLFTVFVSLALGWVLLWIFFGNMRIHDFTLGGAIGEIVITLVVMLLVVFLAILFFALCQQMFDFVSGLIEEISLRG